MDMSKYDSLFASILDEERQIYPFLDAVFGFLWRRSDFFVVQKEGGKIGFPPGDVEKIVYSILKKWQNTNRNASDSWKEKSNLEMDLSEGILNKAKLSTSTPSAVRPTNSTKSDVKITNPKEGPPKVSSRRYPSSSETYNGADRGTYSWSQTISDLEIQVPVPAHIKKSKDVNVKLTDKNISVKVVDDSDSAKWTTLVDGEFCFRLNKDDSVWSLSPGQQIMIHGEKMEERWWDRILIWEEKIDTKSIDASRPITDLSEEEQMKIDELMWTEERKKRGIKSSEQERTERILKDSWNMEGSPFKGTEFDPTILDFHRGTD